MDGERQRRREDLLRQREERRPRRGDLLRRLDELAHRRARRRRGIRPELGSASLRVRATDVELERMHRNIIAECFDHTRELIGLETDHVHDHTRPR